jgi:two-component system, chemotaxis family, protein-glutamate methylesterase/glutaminase
MQTRDVVVIGASAGGVQALRTFCNALDSDLPAAVLIVQHVARHVPSALARLLARSSRLPVAHAVHGQPLQRGHIAVAPPDRHLMIRDGHLVLSRGPLENSTRPAIDVLFRSAAVDCGSRVIGVILTGALDDGTEGLIAIHQAGGICVVQDPAEAAWPSMPASAIRRDHVDHVVPLHDMPALTSRLVRERAGRGREPSRDVVVEDRIALLGSEVAPPGQAPPGEPSDLSCPDCGGVLNQIGRGEQARFRCQIGHAFSQLALRDAQRREIERGLAIAIRTHRDRVSLFERMAREAEGKSHAHSAQRWRG